MPTGCAFNPLVVESSGATLERGELLSGDITFNPLVVESSGATPLLRD